LGERHGISTTALAVVLVTSVLAVASGELGRSQGWQADPAEYPGTTTIAFPRCPATVLTRRGEQSRELRRDNQEGTWDLRKAVWSGFDYPVRSDSWDRGCVKGFRVHGPVPRKATRDVWYDGIGGQRRGGEGLRITMSGSATSWVLAKNTLVSDIEDAYDPNAGGSDARTYLNHVRAKYIRDDCIENEQPVHNMYINNSFFNGCFTAFAERPSGAETARRGRTPADFVVENSLVYVQPQPLGSEYCDQERVELGRCVPKGDVWLGSYGIWKWSDEAASNVEVRHTVFRLDMPSYSSCQAQKWPPGSYRDVTLVWTGKGRYRRAGGCRNTVPQGVDVTRDESVWERALTAWRDQ
jgi:hypothetical protein